MKLFPFTVVLYCILTLVLAQESCKPKCPDQIECPKPYPPCKRTADPGTCKCNNQIVKRLPNGDCPDTLPNCGIPIRRQPDSCIRIRYEDRDPICKKPNDKRKCSEIHFSENLNNQCECPDGTKAWPILTKPWEIKYQNCFGGRYLYTINNKSPGPTVHAIKGDWILIPVINSIERFNVTGQSKFCPEMTSIHWHGVTMRGVERQTKWDITEPPGFPYMDGVPGVSQCPLPSCGRFDYFFQFVDSGTFWYHSHYEIQIADGLSGVMIVKDCEDVDRFEKVYGVKYNELEDFDNYTVNFKDWFSNSTAEEHLKKYMYVDPDSEKPIPAEPVPDTGLVNDRISGDPKGKNLAEFKFTKDKTYRLRLINTSIMTLFEFSIDDHKFEVVEVEGMLVERNKTKMPEKFTNITINTGQRYSILVTADQKGNKPAYWMRFHSKGCYNNSETTRALWAVVRYDDSTSLPPIKPLNHKIICQDTTRELIPYCGDSYTLFCDKPPDNTSIIYMNLNFYEWYENVSKINDDDPWTQDIMGFLTNYSLGIDPPKAVTYFGHKWSNLRDNNTLLKVLRNDPIPNPPKDKDNLNAYTLNKNTKDKTQVYDIFFRNINKLEHPIHLHGHFFYVLGFDVTFDDDHYKLNLVNPIQRDVITVPPRGWAQIRFVSDNPGVWPLHCHMDWHLGIGMMAQFVEQADVVRSNDIKKNIPQAWCKMCSGKYSCTICTNCTI